MMKKIIFIGLLTFLIAASFARADQVNMNISVNGTSNLNISINADDSAARAAINQTQADVYGTTTGSGPRDLILDEIMRGYGNPVNISSGVDQISEICSDSYLQQYLGTVSTLPPADFVSYLKGMGYDDESHISFIWNICQQQYINQHQGQWSENSGISPPDLASIFEDAINSLKTGQKTIYAGADRLATILDSYFANKRDIWVLSNQVNQLNIRVEALEKTMENVSSEAYCQGKLEVMKEYNLSGVKCGTNSTYYWNAKKAGFDNYDTIAYTTCTENWICTDWSPCINGVQGRSCVDKNGCGSFDSKPQVVRGCKVVEQQQQQTVSASSFGQVQNKGLVTKEAVNPGFLDIFSKSLLVLACGFLLAVFIKTGLDAKSQNHRRKR